MDNGRHPGTIAVGTGGMILGIMTPGTILAGMDPLGIMVVGMAAGMQDGTTTTVPGTMAAGMDPVTGEEVWYTPTEAPAVASM